MIHRENKAGNDSDMGGKGKKRPSPAEPQLVPRERRRPPLQILLVYRPFSLRLGLLIPLEHRVRDADDVLAFVVFEQLQRRAPGVCAR